MLALWPSNHTQSQAGAIYPQLPELLDKNVCEDANFVGEVIFAYFDAEMTDIYQKALQI